MTLHQRLMVNTLELDLSAELCGTKMFAPILVGPASHQKKYHPEGELATARGAAAGKAVMVVAGRSSAPIEEIAAQLNGNFWYQAHPDVDAAAVVSRVQQAVQLGCKAVCLTVGTPYDSGRAAGARGDAQLPVLGNPALNWDYVDRLRQKDRGPAVVEGDHERGRSPDRSRKRRRRHGDLEPWRTPFDRLGAADDRASRDCRCGWRENPDSDRWRFPPWQRCV
jgi:isopentenyl diphosphate isomerase/L-lactate dehydrogenase-like FMN-dependent dehydrogenase